MKALFVGGVFDEQGGRESKIGKVLFDNLREEYSDYYNGGEYSDLEQVLEDIQIYKRIYWFAETPGNLNPSNRIKNKHPQSTLVGSVRNLNGKRSFLDLVARALSHKDNLLVEIKQNQFNERYGARILDPLGNTFLGYSEDFSVVGRIVGKRARELSDYTRIGSDCVNNGVDIPEDKDFFETVKKYADKFHELIHGDPNNVCRFLGNASFRCESGFPSFKKDGRIYVSKRNLDKRNIGKSGFIEVEASLPVKYYAEPDSVDKPSVDAPVNILFYKNYPGINYLLHSHVYIKDAPFTKRVVPCGALEEFDEIRELFPDKEIRNFSVNLRGHGAIIAASDMSYMKEINYVARKVPEVHLEYQEDKNEGYWSY